MKSIVRWSKTVGLTLGLTSSILLGSFAGSMRALALSAQQVMERLSSVPVFTLTDQQGAPLVATSQEGQNASPVAGMFISRQDAQAFLENLKRTNPQVAQNVQVSAVSLADAYRLAQEGNNNANSRANNSANNSANNGLQVAYIPAQQQVEAAKAVMQQNGQNPTEFQGVPLFMARAQGENGAYLTIRQGEQEVIPMFFNRDQLQSLLDRLKQVQPDLANSMQIQVVNLEGVIRTLQASNNQELNRIFLVPPQETIDFLRSLEPQQGQPAQRGQQAQPQQQNRNQNRQRPQQQQQQNQQQQQRRQ